MMEEASIAAVNGELSPFTTGVTACRMIGACRDLTDYRRASEWIEATERYCDRQSLVRVSRASAGSTAPRSPPSAAPGTGRSRSSSGRRSSSGAYNATPPQADGFYAIGDIRRLRGDFEGAEAALREAHARGRSPQPALALIRLAEGNVKAAAERHQRRRRRGDLGSLGPRPAPAGPGRDRHRRRRRRRPRGRRSTSSARSSADYPSPALEAGRQVALGSRPPGRGRRDRRRSGSCASAIKGWREVGAPYEVARARAILSRALRARRRRRRRRPRARGGARRRSRGSGRGSTSRPPSASAGTSRIAAAGPQTATKTFMFTDIVGSTSLAEALGDQAWERLLRWHDDMLRGLVAAGGRGGRQLDRRRVLRRLRRRPAPPSTARSRIQQALRDQRAKVGLRLPGPDRPPHAPRRTGAAPTTAGWASTSRPGSPRSPGAARSSPRPRRSPRPARSRRRSRGPSTVKGVSAPVTFAAITWS